MPVTNVLPCVPAPSESTHLRTVARISAVLAPEGVTAEWRA